MKPYQFIRKIFYSCHKSDIIVYLTWRFYHPCINFFQVHLNIVIYSAQAIHLHDYMRGSILHVCIPKLLRYSCPKLPKGKWETCKKKWKSFENFIRKVFTGYTQKTSKALLVLSLLVFSYADIVEKYLFYQV